MTSQRLKRIEQAMEHGDPYKVVWAFLDLAREKGKQGLEFDALSQAEKNLFYIDWFDCELENGGFSQFFTNPSGDNSIETLQALKAIGAVHAVSIFERALAIFPSSIPSKNEGERAEQFEGADKALKESLSLLADEYFDLYSSKKEDVYALAVEYLKDHKSDFL